MKKKNVATVPADYKKAVRQEQQGQVAEVSYSVRNYISLTRKLVTDQTNYEHFKMILSKYILFGFKHFILTAKC